MQAISDKTRFYLLVSSWLIITIAAYSQTISDLFELWLKFDESLGHGLLVIIVCCSLLYKVIREADIVIEPSLVMMLPLVLIGALWSLAHIIDINILEQLLLPIIFLCGANILLGKQFANKITFPILLLYFAVPVWDYLNDYLLNLTVVVVQYLVQSTGITAYVEGNSVFLPGGEILIAAGCSGLRYFIIGSFLALLSCYLYFERLSARLLLVFATIILSLMANWLRIYIVIIIGYLSNMQSSLVAEHEFMGWVIFIVSMIPLYVAIYKYGRGKETSNNKYDIKINKSFNIYAAVFSAFIIVILSGNIFYSYMSNRNNPMHFSNEEPKVTINWPYKDISIRDISWLGVKAESKNIILRRYNVNKSPIDLYIYMSDYNEGKKELVPYIATLYNRDIWSVDVKEGTTTNNNLTEYTSIVLLNKMTQQKRLLIYTFNVGGINWSHYYLAKIGQIYAYLTGKMFSNIVLISIPCELTCEFYFPIISEFIAEIAIIPDS